MLKKVISLILVGMIIINLIGCNEKNNKQNNVQDINTKNISKEYFDNKAIETNEVIQFGNYMQDRFSDKKTPINWIILKKADNYALIISENVLDAKHYNENVENFSWKNSSIRKWLNNDFLSEAFNSNDLNYIIDSKTVYDDVKNGEDAGGNITYDKIFLLNKDEFLQYCKKDYSCAKPTQYALSQAAVLSGENIDTTYWWLRSLGVDDKCAHCVDPYGKINSANVHFNAGIRPAIRIRIK